MSSLSCFSAFYERGRASLEAHGYHGLPDVAGAWPAVTFAGVYLCWHVLRHAVALERGARPGLAMRILDPSQRYDTYVALGNRVLRLYHLEVENTSKHRTARNVSVTLMSYQLTGDRKLVDIRSRLKSRQLGCRETGFEPARTRGLRAPVALW